MLLLCRKNATINAKLKIGSSSGSDTLTRDPTRPKSLTRWPVTRFHLWCTLCSVLTCVFLFRFSSYFFLLRAVAKKETYYCQNRRSKTEKWRSLLTKYHAARSHCLVWRAAIRLGIATHLVWHAISNRIAANIGSTITQTTFDATASNNHFWLRFLRTCRVKRWKV